MLELLDHIKTIMLTVFTPLVTGLGVALFNSKTKKKEDRRQRFLKIVNDNKELFNVIFMGAACEKNINYLALREELNNSKILLELWEPPREEFIELYKIYCLSPGDYNKRKNEVYGILCKIERTLKEYGVDLFENRRK